MARPVHCRKIGMPPRMMGYRPYGMERCRNGSVNLKYEEFESVRLIDYQKLSQNDASKQMNVSRPTFTRIYNSALKTIAMAFAEGRCIEIEGGNFSTDNEWFRCKRCSKIIEGKMNHVQCSGCKNFSTDELIKIGTTNEPGK
jgi:predicted DNA-binding protein (UPF0251 family)